jgi:hypothetical protein
MSWFRSPFHRRPTEEELLNEGLGLAMDWGESWLSPINGRLRERHRHLKADELDRLNVAAQGAMRLAHETVHTLLRSGLPNASIEALAPVMKSRYPWVDEENLARLLKHGIYYAAKVGGHARDT